MSDEDTKRLNYYNGQYLDFQDFQDEQKYHIDMRRRHNIAHHSWGIVTGLELERKETQEGSKIYKTFIMPGMAIDGYGREIIVRSPVELDTKIIKEKLAGVSLPVRLNIWISYHLEKSDPPQPGYEVCDNKSQFIRIRETCSIIYENSPSFKDVDPNTFNARPKPHKGSSDDPREHPWPIYIGTITWDKESGDSSQKIITEVDNHDVHDDRNKRRYIGLIGEEVWSPTGGLAFNPRDGNVGIGTTDPEFQLDVRKTGKHVARFGKDDGNALTIDVACGQGLANIVAGAKVENDKYVFIGKRGSSRLRLHDGSMQLMTSTVGIQDTNVGSDVQWNKGLSINEEGNIGIGKTNPKAKLDVDGDIQANKVRGASWSHTEKINFTKSIRIDSNTWELVEHYTREITIEALSNMIVTLHIPFVGNEKEESRSRIRLEFDGTSISDSTKYNKSPWELHEITLTGLVKGVAAGNHTIQVFAAVDKGKLHIPHYNTTLFEASLAPKIFANLYLLGFY